MQLYGVVNVKTIELYQSFINNDTKLSYILYYKNYMKSDHLLLIVAFLSVFIYIFMYNIYLSGFIIKLASIFFSNVFMCGYILPVWQVVALKTF